MKNSQSLERDEDWKTGTECPESAKYCCSMHPYIEVYVYEGDTFPQCKQKNIPHNTNWHKLLD